MLDYVICMKDTTYRALLKVASGFIAARYQSYKCPFNSQEYIILVDIRVLLTRVFWMVYIGFKTF